ncbi:Xylose isomerase domain-containing protein TIM barrel [Candidatus Sulfotelmatomonas gaucii]|uniref:Xylose isomerase domain-containing protein TIM barrel n=1 Tax=Candidatus Sulfuritelmatomonas gaucii TaxID=2043161 RepID=A0A2N9LX65_9BACT|nr:Xylose isomerase domain-containing protein TIM barrel [Candidatus Sulfotelmatomonas gaucii]
MSTTSRRSFLKATGVVAACAAASRLEAERLQLPIGLQLYSVRDQLPKDFAGTLAQLRSAGFTVVEAAGYYDHSAADFRHAMDVAGLRCVSTHHPLNVLETQLDQWLDYGHTIGLEYIVCSSSGGMHRDPAAKGPPTLDDWRWIAGELNRIGEKVKTAGMTLGVHNHVPEFAVIDGVLVYDELLRLTDPKLVAFEMDCGWVYAAGHNPIDYLSKTPERFPLMHVKDMIPGANGQLHSTEMGRGKIDYAPILRAATGLKQYFIEQEEFDIDPMQALRIDAEYLRNLRV